MTDTSVVIGDSAWPPASYPTSIDGKPVVGWCVYIGGNTPHPWTDAEIAHLKAQPWCRYIVPIFTRSNPQGASAVADADAAIAWARAHGQPSGTKTMWDGETAVNSAYYTAVDQRLQAQAGLHEILYGSKSSVTQNARPSGGYDEASWTGAPYAPTDEADQFGSWAAYDLGMFKIDELWDLHPTPAPPTPPPPVPPTIQEDDMRLVKSATADPVYMVSGSLVWHVQNITALEGWQKSGIPLVVVPQEEINEILATFKALVSPANPLPAN